MDRKSELVYLASICAFVVLAGCTGKSAPTAGAGKKGDQVVPVLSPRRAKDCAGGD